MANKQDVYYRNGKISVIKNVPAATSSFEFQDADDTFFDYRNRLGLVESDENYAKDLRAGLQLFSKDNALNTLTGTWLTGLGNGSITKTVNMRELKAVDEFGDDISTLSTQVYLMMPFVGATSASRLIEVGSAATVANIGTTTFGDYGAIVDGSAMAINTAIKPSDLGSSTGGIGVYVYDTTVDVDACLCGVNGSAQGRFEISYGSASNTLTAYWGGSATSVTGTTLSAAPSTVFIHVHRNDHDTLCLYVNGTRVGSASGSTVVTNGSIAMYVGALMNETSGANWFAGRIGCAVLTAGSVTDANAATIANAVSNMMNKLGRK